LDAAKQAPYFVDLVRSPQHIALVLAEQGRIDGFVIAAIVPAPPVYDPGGLTCVVDDFTVAQPAQWPTLGRALLDEVMHRAKERGAAQIVVVCGQLDVPKREMLEDAGLPVASEWRTRPI
jgi:GNAT superfamily N-acetyltransferase